MSSNKKEKLINKSHARYVVTAVLLAGVIFLSVVLARVFFKDYALKKEIARLEQQIKMFEEKKLRSLELLEYVATDTYVEGEARTKFGMAKEGEEVVIFNTNTAAPDAAGQAAGGKTLTNQKKWWYYFFAPGLLGETGFPLSRE